MFVGPCCLLPSPPELFVLSILLLAWNLNIELNEAGSARYRVLRYLEARNSPPKKVFILIFHAGKGYTFIEHYAGCGMMTETIRNLNDGYGPAAKLDVEYCPRGMDILTSGGFARMTQ